MCLAVAAVAASATLAAGCGAVAQSAVIEPESAPVERDLLSRPGSGLAAFDPVPLPSERPATTTTVLPGVVSSAAAVETRP